MANRSRTSVVGAREEIFDISTKPEEELLSALQKGLPAQTIIRIFQLGFDNQLVIRAIGKPMTVERKIEQHKRLNQEESERLARVCRIVAQATVAFGNQVKAREWLERPTNTLSNMTVPPLSLLDTEIGGCMVEDRLHQIAHGMYA